MNLGELDSAPVPTFMGLISDYNVEDIVKDKKIWNEEHKLSGLFFHGKTIHRTQLCLIMKAVELKLLDLGGLTIPKLMELLTTIKMGNPERLVWDLIIDNIVSLRNIQQPSGICLDPVSVLEGRFPSVMNGKKYQHSYLFGCDPYFLHSYLMTVSRANTPYLSECVTQMFAKSAFAIQRIERKIGRKYNLDGYFRASRGRKIVPVNLSENDLQMDEVMKRQAYCFADAGAHFLDSSDIAADQRERGKVTNVRDSGTVTVQYRSMTSKHKPKEVSWFHLFKQSTMPVLERVTAVATNIFK